MSLESFADADQQCMLYYYYFFYDSCIKSWTFPRPHDCSTSKLFLDLIIIGATFHGNEAISEFLIRPWDWCFITLTRESSGHGRHEHIISRMRGKRDSPLSTPWSPAPAGRAPPLGRERVTDTVLHHMLHIDIRTIDASYSFTVVLLWEWLTQTKDRPGLKTDPGLR